MFEPDVLGPTVDFLADLAGDGSALELGVGTGRVALPLPPGEVFRIFHRTADRLSFDEYDMVSEILYSHHFRFEVDSYEVSSAPYRYVWASELDLMARLAGLRLRERWGDWSRQPFTSDSASHVSVWEKPELR